MLAFAAVASAAFASVALADSTITTAPAPTTIAKAVKRAETSPQPLTAYTYAYSDVPYQVNPFKCVGLSFRRVREVVHGS